MISLRAKKLLRNLIGEGNMFPEKFYEPILVPIVVSVFLCAVPLMGGILFGVSLRNHEELIRFCDPFSIFVGLSPFVWCYYYLLLNHEHFYVLFDDLEDVIIESLCSKCV